MKMRLLLIPLFLISMIANATGYPVGWVPLLGFIENPNIKKAEDFVHVIDKRWSYPLRINYILRDVDYDMRKPQYSQRSIASCHELLSLGKIARIFTAKKNSFDTIPQSEVVRYLKTCMAYQRTAKMKASRYRSLITARQLVDFLLRDYIRVGDGTFLDGMANAKRITPFDDKHAVVQSRDGTIYVIRKISWGDYNGDGYEDVQFIIVHTDQSQGEAIGITVTRKANGAIKLIEAW